MPDTSPEPTFGLPSDRGGKDLGIFLPMANGGWIMSSNAPPLDGSYAHNRQCAVLADELGLDFVMAMAKWRGYGGPRGHWDTSLDSQIMIAGLAEATTRVKVWATVHTFLQNPAVTAKKMATLDQISQGRAGLNVVTGSYKAEFDQMGAWPDLDHDQRYDLAAEWVQAVKRLWSEPSVTMHGQHVRLEDCRSDPKPVSGRPFLVCAGMSPKGMDFTLRHMDAIFLTGRDNDHLAEVSRDAKARARAFGRAIRTYTMMTLVLGETDAVAQAQAESFREGLDEAALRGMMRAYGFLDAELNKENAFVASARSGFMTPRLIGSPASVADQAIALIERAELDGLMVIFPDYLNDMKVFAEEVAPKIRAHFAGAELETAHVR